MDSLSYKFSKPAFITTLDCTEGFLQIPLEEKSRDLSSLFKFEGQNYRFTRVPFGTKYLSMQCFIIRVDSIIGSEVDHFFSRYFDDFKIANEEWEDHLRQIGLELSTLLAADITLKLAKCFCCEREVEFLTSSVCSRH